MLEERSLSSAIHTIEEDESIGAVGGKIKLLTVHCRRLAILSGTMVHALAMGEGIILTIHNLCLSDRLIIVPELFYYLEKLIF